MEPDRRQRIVIGTPLNALWSDEGEIEAERVRNLDVESVTSMLRAGPVQFVVADVGRPLHWTPLSEAFDFWKTDVKDRLVDHDVDRISLDDHPGGYCYVATLWHTADDHEIVLLDMTH